MTTSHQPRYLVLCLLALLTSNSFATPCPMLTFVFPESWPAVLKTSQECDNKGNRIKGTDIAMRGGEKRVYWVAPGATIETACLPTVKNCNKNVTKTIVMPDKNLSIFCGTNSSGDYCNVCPEGQTKC